MRETGAAELTQEASFRVQAVQSWPAHQKAWAKVPTWPLPIHVTLDLASDLTEFLLFPSQKCQKEQTEDPL